jgi:hypothetical protein
VEAIVSEMRISRAKRNRRQCVWEKRWEAKAGPDVAAFRRSHARRHSSFKVALFERLVVVASGLSRSGREVADDLNQFIWAVSQSATDLNELVAFEDQFVLARCIPGDGDATTASEFEQTFVAQSAQRT